MSLGRNLLAGLANSGWSALVGFAVVPFYLKYLGMEAYGLIGFFMTAQVMFQLLDMGMASTMNREVARCTASGTLKDAGKLLHTLAVIYWCVAVAIAGLSVLMAPTIATQWLQVSSLPTSALVSALILMGLVIASRWPIGLYQGVLIGAHRQTISSGINMAMLTISNFGAVFILAHISPTLEAFFVWQACSGLAYALIIRFAAWKLLGEIKSKEFSLEELKRIWKFSLGVSGIALTGILFSQLDKLILSKTLKLDDFGHYILASTIVGAVYTLVTPIFNAMYPKFSALVAQDNNQDLLIAYRLAIGLIGSIAFPLSMLLFFRGGDLIQLWTGNKDVALNISSVVMFLALGTALHGVMYIPYALQLSYGKTGLILKNNLLLLGVMIPLVTFASAAYGALGASIAWLTLHILSALIVNFQIQISFISNALELFAIDAVLPLLFSGLAAFVAQFLTTAWGLDRNMGLVVGFAMMLASSAALLLRLSQVRIWLKGCISV